ncbi:MAG TPA: hypothetical protein PLT49_04490 [Ferruginibacter sp.]|nr:hypothetical protein [Ferruginibacter sp.]HNF42899.1 hypothetical protein [Ferruginibacter sp.]
MTKRTTVLLSLICFVCSTPHAQTKHPGFSVSGTAGITYEGYGLSRSPSGWTGYTARRPWNQVRFNFTPTFKFGKDFSLPFNFNFAAVPTNFAGPYAGIKNQNFGQFITNPMNSFGLNPKYKWAELQLGTQYLKYSDLSTGDIGIFGAGVDLRPKTWRFKFFTGISQEGVNYFAGPPTVTGAYKRKNWMVQVGNELEGKYLFAVNLAKGKDVPASASPPPTTIKPQEGVVISVLGNVYVDKIYFKGEAAQSTFTKDVTTPTTTLLRGLKPFIEPHTSSLTDFAGQLSVGRKSTNFDIGLMLKYIGAGFQTTGYPYLQPDRFDYTLNTRFNAWKNKAGGYKMNVVASAGRRVNNLKNTALKANQFIANLNWYTQFDDHWSLNINYNNFGFQSASGTNPYGIKNVSNDLGVNPTFTWTGTKIMHLVSLSYNYSKYDERDVMTGLTTSNNTHTALLTYVPTYLTKDLSPDFSVLYFYNDVPLAKVKLFTVSSALNTNVAKKKIRLRGQLQYTLGKLNAFSNNNNLIASCNIDYKITKKLSWNTFLTTNYYKYGNEITPVGANYLESMCRTGFQYSFDTKR